MSLSWRDYILNSHIKFAKEIAAKAEVSLTIFNLDLMSGVSHNSLTDPAMTVELSEDDRPPNTLVEGRNMLFLTYAAIFAKTKEIKNII